MVAGVLIAIIVILLMIVAVVFGIKKRGLKVPARNQRGEVYWKIDFQTHFVSCIITNLFSQTSLLQKGNSMLGHGLLQCRFCQIVCKILQNFQDDFY